MATKCESIQTLRRVAWVGLAAVLLVDFISSLRLHGGLSLGVAMLFVFPIAVGLVSLTLMPNAAGTLFRRKDLLVPLALVTVAGKLLTWLAAAPGFSAVLMPSFPLRLLNLSFGISLSFLLHIALAVVYATWVTGCLLELVLFYFSRRSGGHGTVTGSVNAFWTGGYEDDCRWYGKLAEALHTPTLPFVKTLLSLLFGAFAVAIKIAIVQRFAPPTPPVIPPTEPAGTGTVEAEPLP